MAEERIAEILGECIERHGLEAAAAEHRTGSVPLGEPAVIVAVSAAHRAEAFAGAREAIDRIKAEAPIWKREVESDGGGRAGRRKGERRPPLGPESRRAGLMSERRLTHIWTRRARRGWSMSAPSSPASAALAPGPGSACPPATARAVEAGDAPKGDALGVARLAGIQAAKQTGTLIPLAHPLPLTFVDVQGGGRCRPWPGRAPCRGSHGRPHRGRDGGDDRLRGRRPDRLRHGQGAGAGGGVGGHRPAREERWAQR